MSEKYFLGAMTQYGFSTEFGKLIENKNFYTYVLKGGPGTGKSSLMKRVAEHFEVNEEVVRFYCSSDPNSLDAVVLKGSKVIIVDGTSPHVFDPIYPGCCQKIINLGECWDEAKLKSAKDEIIAATDSNKSLHARVKRFLTAISNICGDTYFCASNCIDNDKFSGFINRFGKKILDRHGSGTGRADIRQLTALTEFGCFTWAETLAAYPEIYILADDNYACAHLLIEAILKEANRREYDVILCPCHALSNNIYEHLLIPELGIALVSGSPLMRLELDNANIINMSRFYAKDKLMPLKNRLKLNRAAAASLAGEVYDTVKKAKIIHDDIEKYYIEAMSFDKLDSVAEAVINEIETDRNNNAPE